MTARDAKRAVEAGVEIVWVSNHGGRQLDHTQGSIDALPPIVDAVAGRAAIVVDGGFTRGTAVLKGLALGATVVAVGRTVLWGLRRGRRRRRRLRARHPPPRAPHDDGARGPDERQEPGSGSRLPRRLTRGLRCSVDESLDGNQALRHRVDRQEETLELDGGGAVPSSAMKQGVVSPAPLRDRHTSSTGHAGARDRSDQHRRRASGHQLQALGQRSRDASSVAPASVQEALRSTLRPVGRVRRPHTRNNPIGATLRSNTATAEVPGKR